jgi:ABC-type antimicrobial peptide transport system permease subunit
MFISNMSMAFADGSGFGPGEETQYIINETAAKAMGLTEPVVGKWMEADFGIRGTIVGVVKDFHFQSLYKEIAPLVIFRQSNWANTLYVRTTAQNAGRAIAAIEKMWKEYNPNYAFDYSFMGESFERLYRSDIRTGRLFVVFSLIAVLISCLGLFGLVTYTAETKTKEIGIRKVFGASVHDIVTLLSKEFLVLVVIAMGIAFPLAYYWLDSLLQDFAYHISIGWWIFALTGAIAMILTLLTVGWKAVKSATANPVKAIMNNN